MGLIRITIIRFGSHTLRVWKGSRATSVAIMHETQPVAPKSKHMKFLYTVGHRETRPLDGDDVRSSVSRDRGFTPFTAGAPEGFGLRFELADAPDGAPNGSEFWGTPHTRGRAPKLQARRSEQGLRPQLKPQRRVGRHGHASPTTSSRCARGAGGRGAPPHPNLR